MPTAPDASWIVSASRVGKFERFIDTLAAETDMIMESCGTSHYWGRRMHARGLHVRLLPVQYVRPYVRRKKTDRADTDALLEATRCGEIRPVKTVEQQTRQAIHRVRTQWQTARVARINAMRGLLAEQGHAIPVGARTVLRRVTAILEDPDAGIPEVLRQTIALVVDEVQRLEEQIAKLDRQWAQLAAAHPVATRLQTIPGVGVLTATALVGAVGHIQAFRRGREFASWLGLTPRESSTGARRRLASGLAAGGASARSAVTAPAMGRLDRRASRPPQGHGRRGEQVGTHHLGGVARRRRV